jgi:hypothetical protein
MPSMDWKAFLKPEEEKRLVEIDETHRELVAERRRIYRRARKRMLTAQKKDATNGDR